MSQTNERRTTAAASPTRDRFVVVLQIVILAWLVIITWRYLEVTAKLWSKRAHCQFRDVDPFCVLLIVWLVVMGGAFATGLSAKPLARRLYVQTVIALALAAFVLVAITSGTLVGILVFLWLLLLAFGIGNRLLQIIFRRRLPHGVQTTVFSLGLGFGMYSLFTFALALSALLHNWVAILALLLASLLLRRELLEAAKGSFRGLRGLTYQLTAGGHDFLSISLLCIFALLAAINFVGAIGPEVQYDSVVYHLPVPKIYIQNHRLVEIPHMFRSYWPKGIEMIFCLGLLLAGQVTAKLFSFGFGLVVAAAIFAFCQHIVSPKASLLAASLFYTAPMVSFLATTAYVELGWTLFIFLAIYGVSRWLKTQDRGWVTVAGLMSGFALSSKILALFVIVPLVIALFVAGLWVHKKGLRANIGGSITFMLPTSLLGAPWYVLSYVFTGNPVFPFLNAIFRSPQWLPVNETFNLSMWGTGRDLLSLARLPWDMTFRSSIFAEAPAGAIGVGLLIAVALPLVAIQAAPKAIVLLASLALFCSAEWVFSVEYLRYYVPYLPMISILAVYAVDRAFYARHESVGARRWPLTSLAADVVLLVGLAATLPILCSGFWSPETMPYKAALGLESREEYLSRTIASYDSHQFLNRAHHGEDVRIVTFGDHVSLYADGQVLLFWELMANPIFNARHFFQVTEQHELLNLLRQAGITHLLVNYSCLHRGNCNWMQDTYVMSRNFLETCAEVEHTGHNIAIYRLLSDMEIEQRALYLPTVVELLRNPGFEYGEVGVPSFWVTHGSPELDQSGTRSHSGRGAVRVSEHGYLTQAVPVRENEIYILSEHVRASQDRQWAGLQVNWLDAQGYVVSTDISVAPGTSEWSEHFIPVTAPKGSRAAEIFVSVHGPGRVWFDDLSFKPRLAISGSFTSCVLLATEEADNQLGLGWYGIEEDGTSRWRWMAKEAWLLLGVEGGKDTLLISGHAVTEHFQTGGVTLQVFANEQLVGEDWLPNGDFVLGFEIPRELLQDDFVVIRFRLSDAFVPEGELRELGIIVDSICFR